MHWPTQGPAPGAGPPMPAEALMISTVKVPTDDLLALSRRLWGSFLGRCVRRFLSMAGFDRCIVLSSQAFTALIPLMILLSTLTPAGQDNLVADTITERFGLSGDS